MKGGKWDNCNSIINKYIFKKEYIWTVMVVLSAQDWNRKGTSVTDFSFVNQMCLSDEEPICGMCKLFGNHKYHQVAKISDAYAEGKVSFAKDIQLLL